MLRDTCEVFEGEICVPIRIRMKVGHKEYAFQHMVSVTELQSCRDPKLLSLIFERSVAEVKAACRPIVEEIERSFQPVKQTPMEYSESVFATPLAGIDRRKVKFLEDDK